MPIAFPRGIVFRVYASGLFRIQRNANFTATTSTKRVVKAANSEDCEDTVKSLDSADVGFPEETPTVTFWCALL